MMNTVTHEISFSFDQPDYVLHSLLKLLQQRLSQPPSDMTNTSQEMIVRKALTVLIIDSYQDRAQYIANLLLAKGYHPIAVSDALDAFTLFLQGNLIPFVVILGQEEGSKRFFLLRLLQQMFQKYEWETPLIRIQTPRSNLFTEPTNSSPLHTFSPNTPSHPHAPQTHSKPQTRDTMLNSNTSYSSSFNGSPTPLSNTLPTASTQSGPLAGSPEAVTNPFLLTRTTHPLTSNSETSVQQVPFPEPPLSITSPQLLAVRPEKGAKEIKRINEIKEIKEKVSLVGQSLGRYQITSLIGSSLYSDVYLMYDRLREQECAIKAVQTDFLPIDIRHQKLDDIDIFQQEADLLTKIQHPHILPMLNCSKSYVSGSSFIYKTMPYCPERSLAYWIKRHAGSGAFPAKDYLPLIMQIADAIQYAHEHKILYQNFKLSNILVLNQTDKIALLQVALTDFAVQDGSFSARTSDAFLYVAPERWEGLALPASDQYGLAAITYELLTGRPPFQGSIERIVRQMHMTMQPQAPGTFNPKLPPAINNVLLYALAKKPEDRFGSVALFAHALQRCFGIIGT